MNRVLKNILLATLLAVSAATVVAQKTFNDVPLVGAEIFIEPGQSQKDVEGWFKTLSEHKMFYTRIRMFENYMKDANGNWDFSLFDNAFRYAEKYGINIYANLFPATDFTDVGGFKFPYDDSHLVRIADYIKASVTHFKKFKSLYGWVPINEAGGGNTDADLAKKKFSEWKSSSDNKKDDKRVSAFQHLSFDKENFLMDYNTWYLKWLTDEIRKYDNVNPIHVNTHQIFKNAAEYDFPAWSKFLTSLGGSAHASWHFGFFPRNKYALAMSANSEIIRSGAKNIPWLMTELQGGNNIFSGYEPMNPTTEEIAQWFWIAMGSGSKGALYWCLNARSSGTEAGEWAMVDFNNKPSERLTELGKIAAVIDQHKDLFRAAKPLNSNVHVIYLREAMWVEKKMAEPITDTKFEIRQEGGAMKSAIAYFEALTDMGYQPTFNEMDEFDFSKADYSGHTIVLANQLAIPEKYFNALRHFVKNGGTLIADGLTAFYDDNAISQMMNGFKLADLFGGNISEYVFIGDQFNTNVDGTQLPAHALTGYIQPGTGNPVGNDNGKITAVLNNYGKGKVLWVPTPLGLGARVSNNHKPLIQLLQKNISSEKNIHFSKPEEGVLMKTLVSGDQLITILVNKSGEKKQITIANLNKKTSPKILYASSAGAVSANILSLNQEEVMVVLWP